MKKKLKSLKKVLEGECYEKDNVNGYKIDNGLFYINPDMFEYFGTEIEVYEKSRTYLIDVKKYDSVDLFYEFGGKGWSWRAKWFEPIEWVDKDLFKI